LSTIIQSASPRLPGALSIDQAATILGVPASRFNASWRQNKIAVPYGGQVSRQAVVRAFVLIKLQGFLGDQSGVALEIARALNDPTLDQLLKGDIDDVTVSLPGGRFTVVLPDGALAELRAKIARRRRGDVFVLPGAGCRRRHVAPLPPALGDPTR
jgi:hypothetical protein